MDRDHYKLSDMPYDDLIYYFPKAKNLLDSILVKPTLAYRAGVYSLTSLEGYYDLLKENDIQIDSSVNSRGKVIGKYQTYDYSKTPKHSIWRFKNNVENIVNHGGLIELPISSSPKFIGIIYMLKKLSLMKRFGKDHRWSYGTGETSFLSPTVKYLEYFKKLILGKSFPASMDFYMSENMENLYKFFHKQNRRNMVIVGHPKNASPESIDVLERFLKKIKSSDTVLTFRDLLTSL